MEASSPSQAESGARGRRAPRASGDDREREILATAERLLAERPLNEISVDDLARGAGISRPSFYFYFPSKDAVVLTLIDRLVEEARGGREAAVAKLLEDPRAGWREGIEAFYEAFRARRSLILAGAELRATNPEARRLWAQVMEGWVEDVTEVIEAERSRGAAPPGVPARELAIALVQMNERAQYASLSEEEPSLGTDRVLDVLVEIWLRAIYGSAAPS
ncbi:MAG: TetR/AcrR family transcriptional regulator [Solirubrobacterales bacterium]